MSHRFGHWLALSSTAHAGVLLALCAPAPVRSVDPTTIGSANLDIDVSAPRLAPPVVAPQPARPSAQPGRGVGGTQRTPTAQRPRPATRARTELARRFTAIPDAIDPAGLLASVTREREQRRATAQAAQAARQEARRRATQGRFLHQRVAGPPELTGLSFYLSGRRSSTGRAVLPPALRTLPHVVCAQPRRTDLLAKVHVLVTKTGETYVPYVVRSSGDAAFDRCAVSQVQGMRFSPATDAAGAALDVWIYVQVQPGAALSSFRAAVSSSRNISRTRS